MARFFVTILFAIVALISLTSVNAAAVEARDDEVFITDVAFDRPQSGVDKRDRTSAWSTYIGTSDGSYVTGACGVPYSDKSHGACVKSSSRCGHKVYAYRGNGYNSKYHTVATVVDVCGGLGNSGIYFTEDSFFELGGTEQAGSVKNVNWKWLW